MYNNNMISLIFCGDLKYCPYIERYIERFEKNDIPYEIVFWNRSGSKSVYPENYKYYNAESDLRKSKVEKLRDFLAFRKWLFSYLKTTDCKKFVLLSTLSGIVIGRKLKKLGYKYIFDIRDYSYESIIPYYIVEKNIIKNSYRTVISSEGFKSFLPKRQNYVIAHNFNRNDIEKGKKLNKKNNIIKVVWNGLVRYFDYQREIMMSLANNNRFEMIYHGDGPELEVFKKFCADNEIQNVRFTGAYNNKNKVQLLYNATILNNCYGYKKGAGNKLRFAVSNKFYDGIIYHIPQIVEDNGYKASLVKLYGIGIPVDINQNIAEQIISYLDSMDQDLFDSNCEKALSKILEDDDLFIKVIDDFSTIK